MLNWLGWLATALFAGSYFCKRPGTLRAVQAVAALLWIAYGAVIRAFPVIVANGAVACLAIYSAKRRMSSASDLEDAILRELAATGGRHTGGIDLWRERIRNGLKNFDTPDFLDAVCRLANRVYVDVYDDRDVLFQGSRNALGELLTARDFEVEITPQGREYCERLGLRFQSTRPLIIKKWLCAAIRRAG